MTASEFGPGTTTSPEGREMERAAASARDAKEHGEGAIRAAAHRTMERADDATEAMGDKLRAAGDRVRERGERATDAVAHKLDATGHYLQEEGLSGAAKDLTMLIRRHPIPSLFVGLGIGYLVAHALSHRA